jgi:hypothetical protein
VIVVASSVRKRMPKLVAWSERARIKAAIIGGHRVVRVIVIGPNDLGTGRDVSWIAAIGACPQIHGPQRDGNSYGQAGGGSCELVGVLGGRIARYLRSLGLGELDLRVHAHALSAARGPVTAGFAVKADDVFHPANRVGLSIILHLLLKLHLTFD